jgi:hypothetical protein
MTPHQIHLTLLQGVSLELGVIRVKEERAPPAEGDPRNGQHSEPALQMGYIRLETGKGMQITAELGVGNLTAGSSEDEPPKREWHGKVLPYPLG